MPDVFIAKPENQKIEEEEKKDDSSPQSNPKSLLDSTKHHTSIFTSYVENPIGVSFQDQEAGENILLFLRKHIITNLPWIVVSFILILIPLLISILIEALAYTIPTFLSPQFIFISLLVYYTIVFAYIFANFITWYYNISIVTNIRVIDIDYSDLIYKDVAVTKLSLLEDVRYVQGGFIRSLFNYGDVFLQTAGETENFDFLAVPKPARAVKIVQELIGKRHG